MKITCEKIEAQTWKAHLAPYAPGYGRTIAEAVGDYVMKNIEAFDLAVHFPGNATKEFRPSADN